MPDASVLKLKCKKVLNQAFFSVQKASRVKGNVFFSFITPFPLEGLDFLVVSVCLLQYGRRCWCELYHLISFLFGPPFNVMLYGITSFLIECSLWMLGVYIQRDLASLSML